MSRYGALIKGDRVVWVLAVALAAVSFLSVYSASSNLAYLYGNGNTIAILGKHFIHLVLGFALMYGAHKIPYRYYAPLSTLLMPLAIILLLVTLIQGTTIGDANASRWIRIPFLGLSFQTSTLASLVLLIYIARYFHKNEGKPITFKASILPLLVPIVVVCGLVLPANLSTAAIIFVLANGVMFVGGYPFKNLLKLWGIGLAGVGLFLLVVLAFPNISNRVDTWKSRIENFANPNTEENYQVEKAKMAIAQGGLFGKGPGKSVQKNFLPQSSSDFIYAVIIEEYGLLGGMVVLLLYTFLFIRFLLIAHRSTTLFGKLLTLAAGSGIILQAFINMGVAVHLFPVTGQTLPLISAGGSSIWMTCIAFGIVLSASRANLETTEEDTILEESPTETTPNDLQPT